MDAVKTPEIAIETLPNDIAQCHAVIVALVTKHNELAAARDQLAAIRDEQAATICRV